MAGPVEYCGRECFLVRGKISENPPFVLSQKEKVVIRLDLETLRQFSFSVCIHNFMPYLISGGLSLGARAGGRVSSDGNPFRRRREFNLRRAWASLGQSSGAYRCQGSGNSIFSVSPPGQFHQDQVGRKIQYILEN